MHIRQMESPSLLLVARQYDHGIPSLAIVKRYLVTNEVTCAAYSLDRQQIASGGADCSIRLWNVATGDCGRNLSGHSNLIWDIVYSPRRDRIATAGGDDTIPLWDLETGACHTVLVGHINPVLASHFHHKGISLLLEAWTRQWGYGTSNRDFIVIP